MNFFEQMITAIYRFQSYPKLIMQKMGRVIGYLIIFTLIIAVINTFPFVIGYKKLGGIEGAINKYVPDFSIENGRLQCEHIDYTDEIMGVKIYIDGNEDVSNIDVSNTSFYLLADSAKMIIGNGINREVIAFSQFKDDYITKDKLISIFMAKKVKLAIFTIIAVSGLISLCLSTLASVFMLSCLAMFINVCFVRSNTGFGALFKLSVYARTFPSIILFIVSFSGFAGSSILYWGLLITYIYLGLRNIKKQEAIILAEL